MKKHINYYLLATVAILMTFGILFFATLSAPTSLQKFQNTYHYSINQFFHLIVGLIIAFIAFKTPLPVLKKISPILFFANLLLMVFVFLPFIGIKLEGATRWIKIGSFNFQPSEFLKLTSVLYFSSWLADKFPQSHSKKWYFSPKMTYNNFIKVFLPFVVSLGIIAVIVYFQRDISTLGIIIFSLVALYFIAGAPLWHLAVISVSCFVSFSLFILSASYRLERIKVFLQPELDPLGIGLHLKQSLIAIGSGGIFGKGWGMSSQKFGYLPQALSDSSFAIIGEEIGLAGAFALIIIFLFFLWQGFKIAGTAEDKFSKLTAAGITIWIMFQAFLNILSTIGFFPLSGVPLPFINYGGSHIIAEITAMGILLNISKEAYEK